MLLNVVLWDIDSLHMCTKRDLNRGYSFGDIKEKLKCILLFTKRRQSRTKCVGSPKVFLKL